MDGGRDPWCSCLCLQGLPAGAPLPSHVSVSMTNDSASASYSVNSAEKSYLVLFVIGKTLMLSPVWHWIGGTS